MLLLITLIAVISAFIFLRHTSGDQSFDTSKNTENSDSRDEQSSTDPIFVKIENKDYRRFILLRNTSSEYIKKGILQFNQLSKNTGDNGIPYSFAQEGEWHLIEVEESVDFYEYHNLIGWLSGYPDSGEIPGISLGFAKHKGDEAEDYLCFLDSQNEYGDTLIGAFRSEKPFSIYLPEAYVDGGNLTLDNTVQVTMAKVSEFLKDKGFDPNLATALDYSIH